MATVLILYHSQEHGNTHGMAEAVAEGVRLGGAEARMVNTNEWRLDMAEFRSVDAVAFGTPDYYSYIAGGMKMFLDDWYIAKKSDPRGLDNKPYGLFYSHGGGGAVRGVFEKLFARMGHQIGQTIESCGPAGESVREECVKLGRMLARAGH